MASYNSTITVRNGWSSSPLIRISYRAMQGNWVTPPRSEIGPAESDTFQLGAANNVSEGEVVYRLSNGAQFTLYFRCASGGNTVTGTPAPLANITYNASGTPLIGNVQILEA